MWRIRDRECLTLLRKVDGDLEQRIADELVYECPDGETTAHFLSDPKRDFFQVAFRGRSAEELERRVGAAHDAPLRKLGVTFYSPNLFF